MFRLLDNVVSSNWLTESNNPKKEEEKSVFPSRPKDKRFCSSRDERRCKFRRVDFRLGDFSGDISDPESIYNKIVELLWNCFRTAYSTSLCTIRRRNNSAANEKNNNREPFFSSSYARLKLIDLFRQTSERIISHQRLSDGFERIFELKTNFDSRNKFLFRFSNSTFCRRVKKPTERKISAKNIRRRRQAYWKEKRKTFLRRFEEENLFTIDKNVKLLRIVHLKTKRMRSIGRRFRETKYQRAKRPMKKIKAPRAIWKQTFRTEIEQRQVRLGFYDDVRRSSAHLWRDRLKIWKLIVNDDRQKKQNGAGHLNKEKDFEKQMKNSKAEEKSTKNIVLSAMSTVRRSPMVAAACIRCQFISRFNKRQKRSRTFPYADERNFIRFNNRNDCFILRLNKDRYFDNTSLRHPLWLLVENWTEIRFSTICFCFSFFRTRNKKRSDNPSFCHRTRWCLESWGWVNSRIELDFLLNFLLIKACQRREQFAPLVRLLSWFYRNHSDHSLIERSAVLNIEQKFVFDLSITDFDKLWDIDLFEKNLLLLFKKENERNGEGKKHDK